MFNVVPRVKPAAPDTWELRTLLLRTEQSTVRIPIEFPGPSTVVGAYPSVVRGSAAGGLLIPTVDDIMVLVDLDNTRRFTSGPTQGQTSQASQGSQFVTLGALSSLVRDLYWDLGSPRPVVGVTFSWKWFTVGTPRYEDAIVSLALMVHTPGIVAPQP